MKLVEVHLEKNCEEKFSNQNGDEGKYIMGLTYVELLIKREC